MRRPRSRPNFIQYERSLRPCLAPLIAPRRRGPILKRAPNKRVCFPRFAARIQLTATGCRRGEISGEKLDAHRRTIGWPAHRRRGARARGLCAERALPRGHRDRPVGVSTSGVQRGSTGDRAADSCAACHREGRDGGCGRNWHCRLTELSRLTVRRARFWHGRQARRIPCARWRLGRRAGLAARRDTRKD